VVDCLVFQQNRVETNKTLDFLQTLLFKVNIGKKFQWNLSQAYPTPKERFITVVVDRLTKYSQFFALSHPFKASTIATAFMETIKKPHGNPNIIVSDIDPIFIGISWT